MEKPQFVPISGKCKQKLFKKWRRDQGLITMKDYELAVAEERPAKEKHTRGDGLIICVSGY
ncbi:hypothetical protein MKW94_005550, partial [Papaver nudicaule]|nr:hypothetical protein [Papaver nudicaule]